MTEIPVRQRHVRRGETMKYAYSLKTERVKEDDFPYHGQSIRGTSELIEFARSLQDADVEKFLVLYQDAQNHVICIRVWGGDCQSVRCISPRGVPARSFSWGLCGDSDSQSPIRGNYTI